MDFPLFPTLAAALVAIGLATTWMSPDALRWCLMRLAMRLSMRIRYIEAGRDAAKIERERLEVAA